jgi:hypothetical protein
VGTIIDTLITDRTAADAQMGRTKGFYNADDLNRVESAVQYLAGQLQEAPEDLKDYADSLGVAWAMIFDVPYGKDSYTLTTKTDWIAPDENDDYPGDIPNKTSMERYLGNIKSLTSALEAAYPALPDSMGRLTWDKANALERSLELLSGALERERDRITILLDHTAATWYYSGDLIAGEI